MKICDRCSSDAALPCWAAPWIAIVFALFAIPSLCTFVGPCGPSGERASLREACSSSIATNCEEMHHGPPFATLETSW